MLTWKNQSTKTCIQLPLVIPEIAREDQGDPLVQLLTDYLYKLILQLNLFELKEKEFKDIKVDVSCGLTTR